MKKLVKECSTEEGFRKLLKTAPKDKVAGNWVGAPPPNAAPPWQRTTDPAATAVPTTSSSVSASEDDEDGNEV